MARMTQRGIRREEIALVFRDGWEATDAKPGTLGKMLVFPYGGEWEGQFYEEKEVTVYYKTVAGQLVLLTVKARYGKSLSEEMSLT